MPKKLYTTPATCHVCSRNYLARYNVGKRAKVCTPPSHKCRREEKILANGKRKIITCVEGCCRSRYAKSAVASTMDNAIDPSKVLSNEEFGQVVKATYKIGDPTGIAIRFISGTGCRLNEARLVKVRDMDFRAGDLSVAKVPTLKRGGRPVRSVFLRNDNKLVRELRSWVKGRKPDEFLFPIPARTLQRAVEKILEKHKPDRDGLVHIFRHTHASQLVEAGVDWQTIRQRLGWSSLEMAKRYVHTNEKAIAQALGRIS